MAAASGAAPRAVAVVDDFRTIDGVFCAEAGKSFEIDVFLDTGVAVAEEDVVATGFFEGVLDGVACGV